MHFLGRDDSLAAVEEALNRHHRGSCRATWWIRAQTEPTMRADLVALGVRLNWVGADAKEEDALAAVMEHLRDKGDGLLLIYDNAIDAGSLKPVCHVAAEQRLADLSYVCPRPPLQWPWSPFSPLGEKRFVDVLPTERQFGHICNDSCKIRAERRCSCIKENTQTSMFTWSPAISG